MATVDTFEADNPSFDLEPSNPPPALVTPKPIQEPTAPPPALDDGVAIGSDSWWSQSFGLTVCGKRLSNQAAKQLIIGLGFGCVVLVVVAVVAATGGGGRGEPTSSGGGGGGEDTSSGGQRYRSHGPPPVPPAPPGQLNGEQACEGKGYDRTQCASVGCCQYDSGQCWSRIGRGWCQGVTTSSLPSSANTFDGKCNIQVALQQCNSNPPDETMGDRQLCSNMCIRRLLACTNSPKISQVLSPADLKDLRALGKYCKHPGSSKQPVLSGDDFKSAGNGLCQEDSKAIKTCEALGKADMSSMSLKAMCAHPCVRELIDCVNHPSLAKSRNDLLMMERACGQMPAVAFTATTEQGQEFPLGILGGLECEVHKASTPPSQPDCSHSAGARCGVTPNGELYAWIMAPPQSCQSSSVSGQGRVNCNYVTGTPVRSGCSRAALPGSRAFVECCVANPSSSNVKGCKSVVDLRTDYATQKCSAGLGTQQVTPGGTAIAVTATPPACNEQCALLYGKGTCDYCSCMFGCHTASTKTFAFCVNHACADPAITGPTNGQKCSAMPKQCSAGPEDSCNTGCSVPQDVAAKVTPCDGQSLLFEAYVQPPNFDYNSLKKISKTVFDDKWNGWTPTVQHREIIADLYYANDAKFVQDIPEFKATDRYVMRWRGTITVPKQGTYQFQTVSDDGSMLFIDKKVVVDNDGNHGPRSRNGKVTLTKGDHDITITFYENGGGSKLEVKWSPTPGAKLTRLSHKEAYTPGGSFNWKSLSSKTDTVFNSRWNGWTPIVAHDDSAGKSMWFPNDNSFVKEIPVFSNLDMYVMRWRGQLLVPKTGQYVFQTRSDDGSMIFIDGKVVVDNDGLHGPRTKSGKAALTQGEHPITIVFFEKTGGSMMEVSWTPTPGGPLEPMKHTSLTNAIGCGKPPPPPEPCDGQSLLFEAYVQPPNFDYSSLKKISKTVFNDKWNGWTPTVQHREIIADLYYANDAAFVQDIPEFKAMNNYVMRWRGTITVPKQGTYQFQTVSDDGSMLYLDEKVVVDNDGVHPPRKKSAFVPLTAGPHKITITFYERGGGSVLEVLWSPTPGAKLTRLSHTVLSNTIGCPCNQGLYFEAYTPGGSFNWKSLRSTEETVFTDYWNSWTPVVQHKEVVGRIWYPNDNSFVKEIPVFSKLDRYVLRWRGTIKIPVKGGYIFETNSDDGSMIYIDGTTVVNNDGLHGPRRRRGTVTLTAGKHPITITFYENHGGAKLTVAWTPTPGAKLVPLDHKVLSNKIGCGSPTTPPPPCDGKSLLLEAYVNPPGFNFKSLKSVEKTVWQDFWNGWTPTVQHREIRQDLYYANDAKFVSDIPRFRAMDRYVMRFRGTIAVPAQGTYRFRTISDDGSMLYVDRHRVVDNDGLHGRRSKDGSVVLSKGKHSLTITFFENGGSSMLEVLWTPKPRAGLTRLSSSVLSNTIGCSCNVGLYFEAYTPGKAFNWKTLKSKSSSVFDPHWAGLAPIVQHKELQGRIWYPNDASFVKEIPVFKEYDRYVLRWRGSIKIPQTGIYTFQTTSDDGSVLYIDKKIVVDNDGLHGARSVHKSVKLTAGDHPMVLMFFENHGGSRMELSWTPTPGAKLAPISHTVLSNKVGCGHYDSRPPPPPEPCDGQSLLFEAYVQPSNFDYNSLKKISKTVFDDKWNGWTPTVQHREIIADLYYANDAKFVQDIPEFKATDRYVMRWRGTITVPKQGTYQFQTVSDDGSLLFIDKKLVVDNDNLHGPRSRNGKIGLTKGEHDITIVFYENGGGSMLEVKWSSTPGAKLTRLSHKVLSNRIGCTCHKGLYMEAYTPGSAFNWRTLKSVENTVFQRKWNSWTPVVQHAELASKIWYPNDQAFVKEIPGFKKLDMYVMRWRGRITVPADDLYTFQTTSDDGSMLYIDERVPAVVQNDGIHAPVTKQGTVRLTKGAHDITITFFENRGGSRLEVSWGRGVGNLQPLSNTFLSNNIGCGVPAPAPQPCDGKSLLLEAYVSPPGFNFKSLKSIQPTQWATWIPSVQHRELKNDIYYANDRQFVRDIPGFTATDRYVMRWRGTITVPKQGTYQFQTVSDDGSLLFIDKKLVVDNDNLHGPRSQTGKVTLTQGAHEIQIQFFESGGGSVLKVSWKPPGGGMRRLSNRVLSNTIGCPCNQGLCFEAYSPDKDTAAKLNGKAFNWQTLASTESTVYDHVWNGWTPIVAHAEKVGRIWYPNDQAFVKEIDVFTQYDRYALRWRGGINIAQAGKYMFQTNSDDGSMIYIDGTRVVSNDGLHGPRLKTGSVELTAGLHAIVITFFENHGGAKLEVSWSPTPGAALVPLSHAVLSNKVGCGHTPPPSPVNSGRVTCKKERWLPIATGLRSDFHLVRGRGHPSKTGRDIRSGNPRETTQVRLGPIAAPRAPNRLKFEYEYVVGYGRWGANVPRTVRGPSFTVSVTDAKDSTSDVVVYRSPVLDTYDYDTCHEHGGWGKNGVKGDGCYSNPVYVDVPVRTTATEFYVVFTFSNRDRNMHLNEDKMGMQYAVCRASDVIKAMPCTGTSYVPVPTGLVRDFKIVPRRGAHPSFTRRDIRSGNPHEVSRIRLPDTATPSIPTRLVFNYEYVVGYGSWGAKVPRNVRGPSFTVSVVAARSAWQTVVYRSPVLSTYDYDTCSQKGGWGSDTIKGDGCYSKPVHVDVPITGAPKGLKEFFILFEFTNNDRNMHLNEDGMNMKVGYSCQHRRLAWVASNLTSGEAALLD